MPVCPSPAAASSGRRERAGGESGCVAASGSMTAGSGSYSTSTASAPSRALASVSPTTTATGCPHHTTSSCAVVDRKSTRLNSSHQIISYAVFCLKKKKNSKKPETMLYQAPSLHCHMLLLVYQLW